MIEAAKIMLQIIHDHGTIDSGHLYKLTEKKLLAIGLRANQRDNGQALDLLEERGLIRKETDQKYGFGVTDKRFIYCGPKRQEDVR